jgi:NAD(P)-dependent dehydrogenase (short-subunit alcohol dehydrogenase family)
MSIVDIFRLDEKVALIPGGSGAIGSELARGLAQAGAKVTIVRRSKERAEEAARAVEDAGSEALIVVGDMTTEQDAERCVNETLDRFGRVDIVVNAIGAEPAGFCIPPTSIPAATGIGYSSSTCAARSYPPSTRRGR